MLKQQIKGAPTSLNKIWSQLGIIEHPWASSQVELPLTEDGSSTHRSVAGGAVSTLLLSLEKCGSGGVGAIIAADSAAVTASYSW